MALTRSRGRRETDETDHDEDDRISVGEIEVAAAHFLEQKKHADGDHYDGPHESADGATLAGATNTIAHLSQTSRRSLLGLAVHAIPKHQNAHADQKQRPKIIPEPEPLEPLELIEQEEDACADQENWADGALPGEIVERIRQGLARTLGLGGAKSIDGHVYPECGNADPKSGLCAATHGAVDAGDEKNQENGKVNHSFAVLLVIESAEAGQKSQEEG
jgi:hypothetical protein